MRDTGLQGLNLHQRFFYLRRPLLVDAGDEPALADDARRLAQHHVDEELLPVLPVPPHLARRAKWGAWARRARQARVGSEAVPAGAWGRLAGGRARVARVDRRVDTRGLFRESLLFCRDRIS